MIQIDSAPLRVQESWRLISSDRTGLNRGAWQMFYYSDLSDFGGG